MVKKLDTIAGVVNAQNFANEYIRKNKNKKSRYNFIYLVRNSQKEYDIYLSLNKPTSFFWGRAFGKL